MSKPCKKCGITKPLTEYHKTGSGSKYIKGECKSCISVRLKLKREKAKANYIPKSKEPVPPIALEVAINTLFSRRLVG